jgi:hypothetical protein
MMREKKAQYQKAAYLTFAGLALILLAMGFILSPSVGALAEGYGIMLTHPSLPDFDGLLHTGHFGSAFFNSGLLLLVVLAGYKITGTAIMGEQIAAAMMVLGFSFYGKNILNIWFPIIGVIFAALLRKKRLSEVMALAFFGTATSPIFSILAFGNERLGIGGTAAFWAGAAFATLAGMIIGLIADYLPTLHKRLILFNAGFAAGVSAMLINALQKAVGLGRSEYTSEFIDELAVGGGVAYGREANGILGLTLLVCFAYLIAVGLLMGGGRDSLRLFAHRSRGGNFTEQFGFAATLINMGAVGLIATLYVFCTVRGQLAGPVFGGIFTAVGFAAFGITPRMFLPAMLGVYITAFLTGGILGVTEGGVFLDVAIARLSSQPMLLAAIFASGLCPVVGVYGDLAGIFVGAAHCILAPNVGVLHGWLSLYNNGYSVSLVATFLYPVFSRMKKPAEGAGEAPQAHLPETILIAE